MKAQRLVTVFQASTQLPDGGSRQHRHQAGNLQTSNATHFTSVHTMLEYVLEMDLPLMQC